MNIEPGIYEYDGDTYHFFGEKVEDARRLDGYNSREGVYLYSNNMSWTRNYEQLSREAGGNNSTFKCKLMVTNNSDIFTGLKLIKLF